MANIEEITIKNLQTFLDEVQREQELLGFSREVRVVYRGHGNIEWTLTPSLSRLDIPLVSSFESLEKKLLMTFERQAIPHLSFIPRDKLEWIAIAQHFRLATRLLDWTESPLVALFFAVEDSKWDKKDGAVWSYNGLPIPSQDFATFDEINKAAVKAEIIYFPHHISPRISAQQGCFTVHAPSTEGNFESLESSPNALFRWQEVNHVPPLRKLKIPAKHKAKFRQDLYSLGINDFTLFPDLEGLSRKTMWEIENARWKKSNASWSGD